MKNPFAIAKRSAFVACLLTGALAAPAWSDTLILRNGSSFPGTLVSANSSTVTFRNERGETRHYRVDEVDAIQFGDNPNQSRDQSRSYDNNQNSGGQYGNGQPSGQYGGQNNYQNNGYQNNGQNNSQNYANQNSGNHGNQDDRGYDQARMERVIIPVGTEIALRTNERIDSGDVVEGQTFSAQIAEDVRDTDGSIAIPRGSEARLVTRRLEGNGDITLDVDSVTVQGRRYRVSTSDQELENRKEGVGGNKRTGQFVGGGAVLGAIIGAIAGGGKGAAIGAVAGAGAGAGAQIVTQGKEVHVPAEAMLRFHLDQPLRLHLWT